MLGRCGCAVMMQVVQCVLVQREVLCNMLAEVLVEGECNAGGARAVRAMLASEWRGGGQPRAPVKERRCGGRLGAVGRR